MDRVHSILDRVCSISDGVHSILDRVCSILDRVYSILDRVRSTAFAERRGRHQRVATIATQSWPWLNGQHELGRRQGVAAGWEGWQAGWGGGPCGMEGRVGWRAGSGGRPGDRRGMDLLSKECSGVNIVT